jgi:hypothetical protein
MCQDSDEAIPIDGIKGFLKVELKNDRRSIGNRSAEDQPHNSKFSVMLRPRTN